MPHATPYQWIALRALQTRRTISTNTTSSSQTTTPPSQLSKAAQNAYLKTADDKALTQVQTHLSNLVRTVSTLESIANHIISRAASPKPLLSEPHIPPYTVKHWRRLPVRSTAQFTKFHNSCERIRLNVADLQSIPYPRDEGPSASEKFWEDSQSWGEGEKRRRLRELEYEAKSQETRLGMMFESLRAHVQVKRRVVGGGMGRDRGRFGFRDGVIRSAGEEIATNKAVVENGGSEDVAREERVVKTDEVNTNAVEQDTVAEGAVKESAAETTLESPQVPRDTARANRRKERVRLAQERQARKRVAFLNKDSKNEDARVARPIQASPVIEGYSQRTFKPAAGRLVDTSTIPKQVESREVGAKSEAKNSSASSNSSLSALQKKLEESLK